MKNTLVTVVLTIIAVLFGFLTVICLLGAIVSEGDARTTAIVFLVICAVVLFLCILALKKSSAKNTPKSEKNDVSHISSLHIDPPDIQSLSNDECRFPTELEDGQRLYKEYQHIQICIIDGSEPDFSALHLKDKLTLMQEPGNEYDPDAVVIYDGDVKLGYCYRGIGQDMTNDFLSKGNTVLAELSFIDKMDNILKMHIAYYYNRRK